jgi:hypothetical protein
MDSFGRLQYLLRKAPASRECAQEAVREAPRMLAAMDEMKGLLLEALELIDGQDEWLCHDIKSVVGSDCVLI